MSAKRKSPSPAHVYPHTAAITKAGELLSQARDLFKKLAGYHLPIVVDECQVQMQRDIKEKKGGKPEQKVLQSLAAPNSQVRGVAMLHGVLTGIVRNTYDARMENMNRTKTTDDLRQLHAHSRALQVSNLTAIITRMRNMHSMPMVSIRRGLENKYLGMPTHLWNLSRAYREVPGEKWVDSALAHPSVSSWQPPAREALSCKIDLCCRDNLEWWRSVKFARHKDGVKQESELIHTVTGEHFHIPASLTDHLPDPELGQEWPFLGEYNYSDVVVGLDEMHVFLVPLWQKILCLQESNSMQLLMRPPAEADRVKWDGPTRMWHPNIVLNCGTSSYVDNIKIVKNVRANRKGEKSIIACDMQTFVRLWWLKKKFPSEFSDVVPWAGDFHGLAHLADGIVILNWAYVLEPILLHFDVKGFHLSLNMKETSQRIRWITIMLCAGQQWMSSIFTPAEMSDIPALLETLKHNVPVWCFVGFLFYHASVIWGSKEAKQTTDTHFLKFMWRFSLRVYAHTKKVIYKKGVVQQCKIENDSEPRVAAVMRHHRTCNDTGKPCAGVALDYRNEKVLYICFVMVTNFVFFQTNAEFRRGIHYPSDTSLLQFDAQLDVLRHNHRQVEEEHGVERYRKESCTDLREDIAMMKLYFDEKLGDSQASCRRRTTYSKMTETDLDPSKVGWSLMVTKEQELRDWMQKMIDKGEFGAVGEAPPDLAAELGLTAAELAAIVEPDDTGAGMGDIEVVENVERVATAEATIDGDVNELDVEPEIENILPDTPAPAYVHPAQDVVVEQEDTSSSSSDDDAPLKKPVKKKQSSISKSAVALTLVSSPHNLGDSSTTSPGASDLAPQGESDSDDDVPLSQRLRMIAKKWVEKNKINKALDKDADAYVERVCKLLSAGESNRKALRSKKSESAATAHGLDVLSVAVEARLYYARVTKQNERRPKEILSHEDWPSLGRYYLCRWTDVGYGGQDIEEAKPADYVMQFHGLLEDYRKVFPMHVACICTC